MAGRYRLERELGAGEGGRVWKASDLLAEQAARALKFVQGAQARTLALEFDALRSLEHEGVARVYELLRQIETSDSQMQDVALLVQDYIEGRAPEAGAVGMPARGQGEVGGLLALAADVAEALAAVHAAGIVHGDVKRANIVVAAASGRAVLVDFGALSPIGWRAELSGTPSHFAPEVWQGQRSPAGDLYALGVMLLQLFGLEEETPNALPLEQAIALSRSRLARLELGGLPAELLSVLRSLLALAPEARPEAADAALALSKLACANAASSSLPERAPQSSASLEAKARAFRVLPWVGPQGELHALAESILRPGVILLCGAQGAGKTRALLEALGLVQRAEVGAGEATPTYLRTATLPPQARFGHRTLLHLEHPRALSLEEAEAFVLAASTRGVSLTLVIERQQVPEGRAPSLPVFLLAAREREMCRRLLVSSLGVELDEATVFEAQLASAGLLGRLCRLLEHGAARGRDLRRAQTWPLLAREAMQSEFAWSVEAQSFIDTLALLGGEAPQSEVEGHEALLPSLVAQGFVQLLEGGGLRLRADVFAAARRHLSPASAASACASLKAKSELSPLAAAYMASLVNEETRALDTLGRALSILRSQGDPESALLLLRTLAEDRDRLPWSAGGCERLRLGQADFLRLLGRYREAVGLLAEESSLVLDLLRGELLRLLGEVEAADALFSALCRQEESPSIAAYACALQLRLDYDRGRDLKWPADLFAESEAKTSESGLAPFCALFAHPALPRLRLLEVQVLDVWRGGRLDRAHALVQGLAQQAQAVGADEALARAYLLHASLQMQEGAFDAALLGYARAREAALRSGDGHLGATLTFNLGLAQLECGRLGPAIDALSEGAEKLLRLGRSTDAAQSHYNLANAAFLSGDPFRTELAIAGAWESLDGEERGSLAAFLRLLEAQLAFRKGDLVQVRAKLGKLQRLRSMLSGHPRVQLETRAALLWEALGEKQPFEEALAFASEAEAQSSSAQGAFELELLRTFAQRHRPESIEAARRLRTRIQQLGGFENQLRAYRIIAEVATLHGQESERRSALAEIRSLLDAAARTLSPEARTRFRAVPEYQQAFASLPLRGQVADASRWRQLTRLLKRLRAESGRKGIVEETAAAAVELVHAERAFLVEADAEGGFRSLAVFAANRLRLDPALHRPSTSILQRVLASARPLSTLDARHDGQLDASASVHAMALRSVLALPIPLLTGAPLLLYVDDRLRPAAFDEEDMELLQDWVELSALAIESAMRLRAEIKARRRLVVAERRLARRVDRQALELAQLKAADAKGDALPELVSASEAMRAVVRLVHRVAPSDLPVLIQGESGTGKELVARAIHRLSPRHERRLVSENCGAIAETLLESALFGHRRGAFTGAHRDQPGLFESAHQGSLFLDEIGERSAAMQAKLLRVLQSGEIRPLGATQSRHVDVRIVAATHRDLAAMVREGSFREDLYYRLAVVEIRLPPLRERAEDIPLLVAHLLERIAAGRSLRIDRRALHRLCAYPWPGNVRQLENELRRVAILAEDVIREEHLSPALLERTATVSFSDARDPFDLKAQVHALERRLVMQALESSQGNQSRAAKLLGVSRFGLQKMMQRLAISKDQAPPKA